MSEAFWDATHSKSESLSWQGSQAFKQSQNPVVRCLLNYLPQRLDQLHVLDLGCGNGDLTLYLASLGAQVTALDFSAEALRLTQTRAQEAGFLGQVKILQGDFIQVPLTPGSFDWICGQMVLHHLEPFEDVVKKMQTLLKPDGQGVFVENSSNNPVLRWFRNYISGKHFDVPKYGDDQEEPLTRQEVKLLKKYFGVLRVVYPQMIFLRKANVYFFNKKPWMFLNWADDQLQRFSFLRSWSYEQVLYFKK